VSGVFQNIPKELAPVDVNPTSIGMAPLNDAFKRTALVFEIIICPDTVIEIEFAFETKVEKKKDPEDMM
jgi:hypothetical protein